MNPTLHGKAALVTGASGGIGAETARRLAAAGARVAVHYGENAAAAGAVVAEIVAAGGMAIAVGGDVGDGLAAARIVDEAAAALGGIDILVNVAGTSPNLPFGSITRQNFDALFHVNVLGTVLMMQEAARHFPAAGARVVNVASNLCYGPMAGLVAYSAAKSAIVTLTQGFARELGGRGIAVNAVAPGATDTPMTAWIPDDIRSAIVAQTPLGRFGAPDDIADVIVFLASPQARWINGRTIVVDGGLI